jgi:gamma-F420-2:alpha-L-glutamate ligase
VLGLDVAGVDLLFDGEHFKVCEANSATGFEGIESCTKADIPKEIFHFVRIRKGIFHPLQERTSGAGSDASENGNGSS